MVTSHPSDTHIGKLIDQGLGRVGLSQNKLAERCRVDKSYIAKLRTGHVKHPNEEILLRLATALGQDVRDYEVALLADRGELPNWGRVLENQIGVRLTAQDRQAVERYVRELIKRKRGTG
jgi:transcriptional regulator with XRE-family HTH domain